VLNLGRVGHPGDYPLRRFYGVMLVRLDLRKLVEHRLRKLALFQIPYTVVSKHEPSARLGVRLLVVKFPSVLDFINLPEDHECTFFSLPNLSGQFIRLAHRQPKGRNALGCGKQKVIDATIGLFTYEIARQPG